jgi:hypothetical protein
MLVRGPHADQDVSAQMGREQRTPGCPTLRPGCGQARPDFLSIGIGGT